MRRTGSPRTAFALLSILAFQSKARRKAIPQTKGCFDPDFGRLGVVAEAGREDPQKPRFTFAAKTAWGDGAVIEPRAHDALIVADEPEVLGGIDMAAAYLGRGETAGGPERTASIVGRLTRQQFLGGCCAACFALATGGALGSLLAGCGGGDESAASTTLKVSHLPAGCVQHLLLAHKRGMFAKEGLNVQLTQFNGPGENIQAFVAGAHDVMHNPWTNTITAYARGQKDLRIVCGSGKGGIELVARSGSVRTVDELARAADTGLRVGTLRLDTLELVTYGTMKRAGVAYSDYEMAFFPSMIGMGEALIEEQVDVCSLAQPYGASVVDTAGGTYLADSNDAWGPEAADCVVTVKAGLLEKNQSALETYLEVLREAARQREADYEQAISELVPLYGVEREVLASGLSRQVPQPVLDTAGLQSLRSGMGFLIELGYLEQDNIDQVFDGSVQPKAA